MLVGTPVNSKTKITGQICNLKKIDFFIVWSQSKLQVVTGIIASSGKFEIFNKPISKQQFFTDVCTDAYKLQRAQWIPNPLKTNININYI